jgi:hypothetical protein
MVAIALKVESLCPLLFIGGKELCESLDLGDRLIEIRPPDMDLLGRED